MNVTFYKSPHGRTETIDMRNVYPEDETWFAENHARISMEDLGGTFVIYADVGVVDEDGEPDEAIELSAGRSCEETLKALRSQCEAMLKKEAA